MFESKRAKLRRLDEEEFARNIAQRRVEVAEANRRSGLLRVMKQMHARTLYDSTSGIGMVDRNTGMESVPDGYTFTVSGNKEQYSQHEGTTRFRILGLNAPDGVSLRTTDVFYERNQSEEEQREVLAQTSRRLVNSFIEETTPDIGMPVFSGVYPPNKL